MELITGTVFWFCDQNHIDDTGMFEVLLSSTYTVSWPSHTIPPVRRLGVAKNLEGDTARTVALN